MDDETIYRVVRPTRFGTITMTAPAEGLHSLRFEDWTGAEAEDTPTHIAALFDRAARAVDSGETESLLLAPRGTSFQRKVWALLQAIPAGATRTYGDLAAELGMKNGARAVGGANGANPIAILIPCHRVIASDGSIGGYAYGLEMKRRLLEREGVVIEAERQAALL